MKRRAQTLEKIRDAFLGVARRSRQITAATLVEYTFIIVIVSIAGALMVSAIGKRTNQLLEMTNSNMPK